MPQQREESIVDTVLAIWARRRFVAVVAFLTVLAGGLTVTLSLPAMYRSTASVLVQREELRDSLVRPGLTSELEARLRTIGQEALSRARLETLLERFDLYHTLRTRSTTEEAVEQLRRDIGLELTSAEVANGRSTIAFTLSFRGRDPDTVAQVTNSLAQFYVDENLKIRARQARGAAQLLARQVEETKQRLDEQERRVGDFKRRYIGELPEQVTANLSTLQRLNGQLALNSTSQTRALERRVALEKQLTEIESPSAAAGREGGGGSSLIRLKRELARMRKQYSDRYPDVLQLKAEIAALEAMEPGARRAEPEDPTVAGIRKSLAEVDADLRNLRADDQRLRREITAYQQRVETAPQHEQEFQQMSRDYRATKEQYDMIQKRYQDALVAQDIEQRHTADEFRILDPAIPAREPMAPNRLRLGVLTLALALGVAAAVVALVEHLDTSFHGLSDLRTFTSVPVLASIPRITVASEARPALLRRWLTAASIAAGLAMIVFVTYHLARGNEQLVRMLGRAS